MRASLLLVAAVALLAAACGSDDDETPAGVTEADLFRMVIQAEDLPPGFSQAETLALEQEVAPGIFPPDDPRSAVAFYITAFQLAEDQAEPGSNVCVENITGIYRSEELARATVNATDSVFDEYKQAVEEQAVGTPGEGHATVHRVEIPPLGDERFAMRVTNRSEVWCPAYHEEFHDSMYLEFSYGNVQAFLSTNTIDGEGSVEEMVAIAENLLARIQAAVDGAQDE